MGWLSDIAGIGKAVTGIAGLFMDDDEPEGYGEMLSLAREGQKYSRALADPNDPYFKQLEGDESARLGRQFASDIKDLRTQIRRAKARNFGMDLVNPERRDEMVMKAFTQDRETRRDRARANVRAYLSSALGANRGAAASFAPVASMSSAMQGAKRSRYASGLEALFGGMESLDGGFNFGQPPKVNVNWNSPGQMTEEQNRVWIR